MTQFESLISPNVIYISSLRALPLVLYAYGQTTLTWQTCTVPKRRAEHQRTNTGKQITKSIFFHVAQKNTKKKKERRVKPITWSGNIRLFSQNSVIIRHTTIEKLPDQQINRAISQTFKEFLNTSPWLKTMLPCQDWFHWSETTSQQTLSQAFLVYQIHSGRGTQCQILLTNLLFWHGEAVVHICHINPIFVFMPKIFYLQLFIYLHHRITITFRRLERND